MSKDKFFIKEFFATSWAVDNKTSVYVLAIIISILGIVGEMEKNQIKERQKEGIKLAKIITITKNLY